MSLYLILNISVVIIPLLFSFEKKIRFYEKWKYLIPSIIIVGVIYIGWDVLSLRAKVWYFNSAHTAGINLLGLPIEEWLFFITVPYSCIFIYESLGFYLSKHFKHASFSGRQRVIPNIIVVSVLGAIYFSDQAYTFTVLISLASFLLISYFFYGELIRSKLYWIFIGITFLPFLMVNYILTSVPIVEYNSNAIWGVRFLSIPLEDFIYSFSMLSFYLLIYTNFKSKWQRTKKQL